MQQTRIICTLALIVNLQCNEVGMLSLHSHKTADTNDETNEIASEVTIANKVSNYDSASEEVSNVINGNHLRDYNRVNSDSGSGDRPCWTPPCHIWIDEESNEQDFSTTEVGSGLGILENLSSTSTSENITETGSGSGAALLMDMEPDSASSEHGSGSGQTFQNDFEIINSDTAEVSDYSYELAVDPYEESVEDLELPFKAMCTHTRLEIQPWWEVDLQESKVIIGVNIFNQGNGFNSWLHTTKVGVSNYSFTSLYALGPRLNYNPASLFGQECRLMIKPLPPGISRITCARPRNGRYVSIQIMSATPSYLSLCEVEVLGVEIYHKGKTIATEMSIAHDKPTSQSSTEQEGSSQKAVDGIVSAQHLAAFENPSCLMQSKSDNVEDSPASRIINEMKPRQAEYENCAQIYSAGQHHSGVYYISPSSRDKKRKLFQVYCDMQTAGGGWTVILNRNVYLVHQENFLKKNEEEYLEGFGDLCLEFWLGTTKLHLLTNENNTLRVEIRDSYHAEPYVETYNGVRVDGPSKNYSIHTYELNQMNSKLSDSNVTRSSEGANCLTSGTQYRVVDSRGGWWWTREQLLEPHYLGPNGKLWNGNDERTPIQWCDYIKRNSRENFYIQQLQLKIRPASFMPHGTTTHR